jgi:hypothetical protein
MAIETAEPGAEGESLPDGAAPSRSPEISREAMPAFPKALLAIGARVSRDVSGQMSMGLVDFIKNCEIS